MRISWVALLFSVFAVGCNNDSGTQPSDETPDPTLENIWPNDDGAAWTFELVERTWADVTWTLYPTQAEVPPLPALSELAELLGSHAIGDSPEIALGIVQFRFDGEVTTASGVTAQNLEEKIFEETSALAFVGDVTTIIGGR